jgi:hypothetical protein
MARSVLAWIVVQSFRRSCVLLGDFIGTCLQIIAFGICIGSVGLGSTFPAGRVSNPDTPESDPKQRPSKPVEPPHKPAQRGTRVTLLVGFNFLAHGSYGYDTRVSMPDGQTFAYSGKQSSSGATVFLGAAVTPRGAFRRMTFGVTLNTGGLESWNHSVVPSGAFTPFSERNLNEQIWRDAVGRAPWQSSFSPYVEHELGFLLENKIRIGYQYWHQTGSYRGAFPIDESPPSPIGGYDVRFSNSAHMLRLSINSYRPFDDSDTNPKSRQRSGLVKEVGLQIGSNNSVSLFVSVGPSWSF